MVALVVLAGVSLVALVASPAGATTVSDEATFRAAWANASETQIDLAADITLTCGSGGVAVRNSTTALTLDGHGHTITQTCPSNGVVEQNAAGVLTVQNVTITGGGAGVSGGGIRANTSVTLTNSTVSGNTAGFSGGGVFAGSSARLINSSVRGNTATDGAGGGIVSGTVTLTNSTVSGNTVGGSPPAHGIGGGIDTFSATLTNSTVSGNTASAGDGGGVWASNTVTLAYATVAGNTAPTSANVHTGTTSPSPGLSSFGSVVALAQGGGTDCGGGGPTTSNGFNFSDDASCAFAGAGDRQSAGNPGLGALADNGGPTQTRLPQTGSPLIDTIPLASCRADGAAGITTDQRGVARPQGIGCDIGAVEAPAASLSSQLNVIIGYVEAFQLPHGTQTSLTAKLTAAQGDLSAGDTQDACSDLAAFISHVQAQAGKKLTQAQADQLITAATQLRGEIGC
jgi:hypothetical protein